MFNSNYGIPSTSTSDVNPLDVIEERIKSGESRSIPVDLDKLDDLLKVERRKVTDNDLETICLLISEAQKEKDKKKPGRHWNNSEK